MISRYLTTLLVVLGCGLIVAQEAQEPAKAQEPKKSAKAQEAQEEQEWNITADSIEMLVDKHTIEMEGNVLVEDELVRLSAKKMLVHLDDDNKLKSIEAFGGVTVRKLDSTESATGDTGTYDATSETVTLSGNCILLKDKNTLTGDKVVYDRKKNVITMKRATITLPVKKGGGSALGGFLGNDKKQDGADKKQDGADKKQDRADKKQDGADKKDAAPGDKKDAAPGDKKEAVPK